MPRNRLGREITHCRTRRRNSESLRADARKTTFQGGKARVPGVAWWGEDTRDSRVHTRKAKEFATTDLVRNKLTEAGVVLKDLPDGTG